MEGSRRNEGAYARSGVSIREGDRLKARLPQLIGSTHGPEVLGGAGGFGGLFRFPADRYRDPVLVSSADGVGTKLKVAFAAGRHDTIGEDLVNHCVNDIAVCGASPLFFLDYLAGGGLEPAVFEQILAGLARGCSRNRCALVGGETAQMPGFYQQGEYDISGTIVGVVEREAILDGKDIRPGDAILGLPSDGLHTNGYTLAREILFQRLGLETGSRHPLLERTVGEELLRIHRSYLEPIGSMIRECNAAEGPRVLKALAHITGGGFAGNIPRVLPPGASARIDRRRWRPPPLFGILQESGGVDEEEMYQVFNMGVGLVAVVEGPKADAVLDLLERTGSPGFLVGRIEEGDRDCRIL